MFFQQFSLDGLACQSYLIGDRGQAVVVDPQRDVEVYLDKAKREGFAITHVVETHLHADHVSGNTELAERTGTKVYLHPDADALFPHVKFGHGDEILLGGVRLRAVFTPGHTPEHICLTVADSTRSAEPWFVLTGDTLFVGDVGRPDLFSETETLALAGQLYDSLHGRLLTLPDGLEVYPAHGAGSLCGRSMSAKLSTTIGFERKYNYALQIDHKEEFVRIISTDLPVRPPNVTFVKMLNREGPPVLGAFRALELSASRVRRMLKDGAVLVDTREPGAFGEKHAKGALNVALSSTQFATRLGFLVQPGQQIIFVARNAADCQRAARAAARIGLDGVAGFITATDARILPQSSLAQWDVQQVKSALADSSITLLDVRDPSEWSAGHAPGAIHIPLGQLAERLTEVPRDRPVACMCTGGMRSSSACSLLAREGFAGVVNIPAGFGGWEKAQLPIEK